METASRTVTCMKRRLAVLPASLLGMLMAHNFAYRLVAADAHQRHLLLESTGHTWNGYVPLLVGLFTLGILARSWQQAAGRGRPVRLAVIIAAQASTYALVEIVERALHGSSLWPGLSLVGAGALCQLPAALVVWALIRFVVDPAVAAIRSALRSDLPRKALERHFTPYNSEFHSIPARHAAGRGPPLID